MHDVGMLLDSKSITHCTSPRTAIRVAQLQTKLPDWAWLAQVRLMEEKGYVLGNIDCTIIAQKPKLSPHKVGRAGGRRGKG